MTRALSLATTAALLLLSSPANANQPAQAEAEAAQERDCIAIAYGWSASAAETTAILDQPVPASYLARLNNREPCAPGAPFGDLIQWHLQFGNEQSTLAALRFIVGNQYRQSPEGDIFLARQLVMAADFWRSAELLDFSRRYVGATGRWLAQAQTTGEDTELAPGSTMDSDDVLRWAPDVVLRAAVAKAEISGDRRDYDAATTLLQQLSPADFLTAAQLAYGSGDDFCDWGTGWIGAAQLAVLSERCEEFETAGSNMWNIHARLNFSRFSTASRHGSPLAFATEHASSFLARQRQNDSIAPGSQRYHDEIYRLVALYTSEADRNFRRESSSDDLENAAYSAQYPLVKALSWIAGASHPNLFRRVAARYLELDALARSERPADARPNYLDDRYVTWLREEVALLDRLYGRRDFASAHQR